MPAFCCTGRCTKHGLCTKSESIECDDGLALLGCRITNAVKCLPPENKPTGAEVRECNRFLHAEIAALPAGAAILALGGIAHGATLKAVGVKPSAYPFGHAREFRLPGDYSLIDSYHCSRYNTQTRRLTPAMFSAAVARARVLAGL